ncbi:hypothetical protein [Qipengyuania sediminis]|uniref:hypothetical protein n=1 Tax=Qipengyuania sediminis TaxID=1532023 RepID=UPI00105A993B|nr:hypothetical protein [Qipengyuania sediminis]
MEGVCLYPVLGHVGWDDERYGPDGPIDITVDGGRAGHPPSRAAIARMRAALRPNAAPAPRTGHTRRAVPAE